MSDIEFTNIWENAAVTQRCVIIHGKCAKLPPGEGSVVVYFDQMRFPALRFPLADGFFKAFVPLEEGPNKLKFEIQVDKNTTYKKTLNVRYLPVKENPPVHFCLLVAKDSPFLFETMPYKKEREGNDLGTAVKKMRMAAYMMSAFTMEQMNRNGCGFRSFFPYSEEEEDTITNRDHLKKMTAHIHIVKVDKTKDEINDPNRAQQNHDATDNGALFGFASDALKAYGGPFATGDMVNAACIYLDTHYDQKLDLIEGHAALGGCVNNIRLAIFGGHGLWSWPTCIEDIPYACLDETLTDKKYVGNDTGGIGCAWEAMCISMGAFQHEVGHMLGCPHEPEGIMLRGYIYWQRAFTAIEGYSNVQKKVVCRHPMPQDEAIWYRGDIVRFLNHPSFSLPGDINRFVVNASRPLVFPLDDGIDARCPQGIYMVDIQVGEFSRAILEYNDLPSNLRLTKKDIQNALPNEWKNKPVHLHVHGKPMEQTDIEDLDKFISESHYDRPDLKFTQVLGNENGDSIDVSLPAKRVSMVRVFSGNALDAVEFCFHDGTSVKFGKDGGSPHEIRIDDDDEFLGLCIMAGYWIDAAGVITKKFTSPVFGGTGGSRVDLVPPQGYRFAGLHGWAGSWMSGLCLGYSK
ncbi:putative metalloendopeptidase [Starmerella bacillaris]|uniref:Metalloendopeptidase n=1 Tax=Starmerella bacillaris TaxID=1247836 RepID=A0AAV5RCF3_STABA|nr:putative metalloendopeptidase [Starmerella bacillaris]